MFSAVADFIRGVCRLFPAWFWTALAGVVACIVVGFVSYRSGQADERAAAALRTAEANAIAQARDAAAKESAAAERAADAIETAKLAEELRDAVQNLPDATPSDRRLALACARLRHQGTDTTGLPECR